MRIASLASGSRGNCLYIEDGADALLLDVGISYKQVRLRCSELELDLAKARAVLVSHSHGDHCRGLRMVSRELGIPFVMTRETANIWGAEISQGVSEIWQIEAKQEWDMLGFHVRAWPTVHDTAGAVGFSITSPDGVKMLWPGESGRLLDAMRQELATCDALFVEANYEPAYMPQNFGKRPWKVQERIVTTHLSNLDVAGFVPLLGPRCKLTALLHLSADNNDPDLARAVVQEALRLAKREDIRLVIASQTEPSEIFEIVPALEAKARVAPEKRNFPPPAGPALTESPKIEETVEWF